MRQPIETAPKDGKFVIVDDDATRTVSVNPRRARRLGAAIIASLLLMSFGGTYFGAEIGAFVEAHDLLAAARQTAERAAAEAQQARDRIDVLTRDLATARREIETQTALSTKMGAEATQIKRAADSATADFQQALQQERDRAEALGRELAATRSKSDAQISLAAKTGEEAARARQTAERAAVELRQEHDRAEMLARELLAARGEIKQYISLAAQAADGAAQARQAAEGAAADFQRALQHERDRAEDLQRELAAARNEIATKMGAEDAQAKQAAERASMELRQALQLERDRAAALAREVAAARDEIKTQVSLAATAGDDAAQARQAAERAVAELRQVLQQERDQAEALARELESARRAIDQRLALEREPNTQISQVKQAAAEYKQLLAQEQERSRTLEQQLAARQLPAVAASAVRGPEASAPDGSTLTAATSQPTVAPKRTATGGPEADRLVARAGELLGQGNIGAARIVLEHAADMGSAQASFALAETYDPLILATWRTYGTRGDVTKARELYAKAHAGGIQEAQDRLSALRQ